ncbi:MAG: diadenylate cyclase CdaA [Planctomycetota bacterium]
MNLFEFISEFWKPTVEILIIGLVLYGILRFLQGTRGLEILKGIVVLFLVVFVLAAAVSRILELPTLTWLLGQIVPLSILALLVVFQPEIRRGLTQLGRKPFFGYFIREQKPFADEIIEGVMQLSKRKIGAIIAIERDIHLRNYTEEGTRVDAEITPSFLVSLFWPGSPLHDGAVIIQHRRILAAGCILPLTDNPDVDGDLGTRHRAALGLTEETDAVAVVVSEETGVVSVARKGLLVRNVDREALRRILQESFEDKT